MTRGARSRSAREQRARLQIDRICFEGSRSAREQRARLQIDRICFERKREA